LDISTYYTVILLVATLSGIIAAILAVGQRWGFMMDQAKKVEGMNQSLAGIETRVATLERLVMLLIQRLFERS
jgi:hypothetical protein